MSKVARNSLRHVKKPSQLIRLAVNDLSKAEKSKNYRIDMGVWHSGTMEKFTPSGKPSKVLAPCALCFGGAVMAFSCKVDSALDLTPFNGYFDSSTQNKIRSLDAVRQGEITHFLSTFYNTLSEPSRDRKIKKAVQAFKDTKDNFDWDSPWDTRIDVQVPEYNRKNPKPFKAAMRKIAKVLEGAGL